MNEFRDQEIDGALARSVEALREEVPVRSAWRAELLARIDGDRSSSRRSRLRPWVAVAAGIGLLIAGFAAGRSSRSTAPAVSGPVPANVRFVYVAPGAAKVSVVGDFNQWNAEAMPLRKLSDGTWIVDVPLGPGRYAYAFVVDGRIEVDPSAPRADGEFGENSVLMVRGS